MSTTLILDDDVAQKLQELACKSGESFKGMANQILRKSLRRDEAPASLPRFVVHPKACGFRDGVSALSLNRLNDELEIQDFERKRAASAR